MKQKIEKAIIDLQKQYVDLGIILQTKKWIDRGDESCAEEYLNYEIKLEDLAEVSLVIYIYFEESNIKTMQYVYFYLDFYNTLYKANPQAYNDFNRLLNACTLIESAEEFYSLLEDYKEFTAKFKEKFNIK